MKKTMVFGLVGYEGHKLRSLNHTEISLNTYLCTSTEEEISMLKLQY